MKFENALKKRKMSLNEDKTVREVKIDWYWAMKLEMENLSGQK